MLSEVSAMKIQPGILRVSFPITATLKVSVNSAINPRFPLDTLLSKRARHLNFMDVFQLTITRLPRILSSVDLFYSTLLII